MTTADAVQGEFGRLLYGKALSVGREGEFDLSTVALQVSGDSVSL